jgi:hypothetical protein
VVDGGSTPDTGVDAATDVDASSTADAGACHLPSDLSSIDDTCGPSTECPADYVCQSFSGAALTMSCQIPCEPAGCPCPDTTSCTMHDDKTGVPWFQCDPDA